MSLVIIFGVLFSHFIGDFVLQTDWQAKNKSTNNKALISHTLTYTLVWLVLGLCFYWDNLYSVLLFCLITFLAHTLTDYITSRINTKLWKKGDVHNFFVSVGFDQVLHYIQLFLTFYFLLKK